MEKVKQHIIGLEDFKGTQIEQGFKKKKNIDTVPVVAIEGEKVKPRNPHHDKQSGKFSTEMRAKLSQSVQHIVLTSPLPASFGGDKGERGN